MKNSNLEEALKVPKLYLNFAGCWTYESPINLVLFRRYTAFAMAFFMTFFGIVDTLKYIDDFIEISERLSLTSTMIAFIMKLFIFTYNNDKFMVVLKHMGTTFFSSYRSEFDHHLQHALRICDRLGNLYQVLCCGAWVLFALVPFFSSVNLPYYFPWEPHGLLRILIYAFQTITLGISASLNGSMDILASFLMCLTTAQIKICNDRIRKCTQSENEEDNLNAIKICVQHHTKIIEFVQHLEAVFTYIFLVQYMSSIVAICNSGFQMVHITSWVQVAFMSVYFNTMACQLTMYCWFGNEIILSSSDTGKACYDSDWVNNSAKIKKMLIIIVERAKKPIFLTAGKFSLLSLITLTSVVNSAYSYFALLQRLYSKEQQIN